MKKLIILRGLPGSGKTTLATKLLSEMPNAYICSADHFFTDKDGNYNFDFKRLPLAHLQCRYECERAMIQAGINDNEHSTIIIDNTNILQKHFKQYMRMAQYYHYEVEIMEPQTKWKYNPDRCAEKTSHNVPLQTIKRMAMQFEKLPKPE